MNKNEKNIYYYINNKFAMNLREKMLLIQIKSNLPIKKPSLVEKHLVNILIHFLISFRTRFNHHRTEEWAKSTVKTVVGTWPHHFQFKFSFPGDIM